MLQSVRRFAVVEEVQPEVVAEWVDFGKVAEIAENQSAEAAVGDIQYIEVFAEAPGKTAVAELVGSSAVAVRRVESPLPVVVVTDQGNRLAAAMLQSKSWVRVV
jgi:hypothetical protein